MNQRLFLFSSFINNFKLTRGTHDTVRGPGFLMYFFPHTGYTFLLKLKSQFREVCSILIYTVSIQFSYKISPSYIQVGIQLMRHFSESHPSFIHMFVYYTHILDYGHLAFNIFIEAYILCSQKNSFADMYHYFVCLKISYYYVHKEIISGSPAAFLY